MSEILTFTAGQMAGNLAPHCKNMDSEVSSKIDLSPDIEQSKAVPGKKLRLRAASSKVTEKALNKPVK